MVDILMVLVNRLHIKFFESFEFLFNNYVLKAYSVPGAVGDKWLNRVDSMAWRNFLFNSEMRPEIKLV